MHRIQPPHSPNWSADRGKWLSSTFANDYRTVQSVLEAYGAYKALRGAR